MRPLALLIVPFLYAIFSVASALAGVVGLVGLCFGRTRYISHICRAMDCTLAAMFGYDGRSTVSKECGRKLIAGKPCTFCDVLCELLHRALEKAHCEKEGTRE
jgi:uncharacterized protein (DUF697 family)